MRWVLITAAILGASSIIIGAALKHLGGEMDIDAMQTALRYHQLHSVVLLALGLYVLDKPPSNSTIVPAALFILGTLIFSGSLYTMVIWNISAISHLTPIGGITLITGWLSLILLKKQ